MKKAIIIVIDSFGIGALPDASEYGDTGANTVKHICENTNVRWSTLQQLGLGNASLLAEGALRGCEAVENPLSSYGIMKEKSPGKDTTTGHWEMSGIILDNPFTVFPPDYPSFPAELVEAFCERAGIGGILGNKASSGTEIIAELGEEHKRTGWPICYTSADSVFQIAGNTEIIPPGELYRQCEIARSLCDEYRIGRIIARPFIGEVGNYTRTKDRRDYSIALPGRTVLDHLQSNGVRTQAVGKIGSIFNESGIVDSFHDAGNTACIERMLKLSKQTCNEDTFIFVNLVDTDMLYGHRRDVVGYGEAVNVIDKAISQVMEILQDGDLLVISGDHGCDPVHSGTDHTREYVPLLWFEKGRASENLGIRDSFADLSQSICSYFAVPPMKEGISFRKRG